MSPPATLAAPLADLIALAPIPFDATAATDRLADLLADPGAASDLHALAVRPAVRDLLLGILGCSPYLTGLMRRDPARLAQLLAAPPDPRLTEHAATLAREMAGATDMATAMRALRHFKAQIALLTAIADLGGVWPVMTVTAALTKAADTATAEAIRFLFAQALRKGDWAGTDPAAPEKASGYMVLAMGKHGAHELNYSSDIDLIVFFDPLVAKAHLKPGLEQLAFFVRMTRDLVRLLQERTEDGYVFRTDLRLRPDPGSTQVAISIDAALNYYESFGQNWERAALIKARPIAGDIEAGRRLLKDLAPFIWRKHLDFAAIADIHAMKRQIHAFRGFGDIGVAGHNIKLGRGGIREIEFFAQTQQLIAGGRQTDLRAPATLDALQRLVARNWIKPEVRTDLEAAYVFLRQMEHRLQMLADEQTQTLPEDASELARLANFAGFATTDAFAATLLPWLGTVQKHYAQLFETMPALTTSGANMVFAGEADDPGTIAALARMGYERPSDVIAAIRGWHHGRYPAVRSARARELLTEVQPLLIEALSETADPDLAFTSFDRFLAKLPSGVQLFSLLRANPKLMALVASIMGSAPRLARIMSHRRHVLDAVLDPGFFGALPDAVQLETLITRDIADAESLEAALDRARILGAEQMFLVGVRVLSGTISAGQASATYTLIAEYLIRALQDRVLDDLSRTHGSVPGGAAAVIAMGKLGGREMTASSDLDLIVVYDFASEATQSSGPRALAPSQYYNRFTQRLISALSAPTAEGTLYEVDMRLRPSGQKGPVATQLSSFIAYQTAEAWTWEHMALTRARVVSGPPELRAKVEAAIRAALVKPRDRTRIAADIREMRDLVFREKGTADIWGLKQVRGGMVDIEFMTQFLQLIHAADNPEVLDTATLAALRKLAAANRLSPADAEVLIGTSNLLNNLGQVLRLCLDGTFEPATAPDGLKTLLAEAGELPDFQILTVELQKRLDETANLFDRVVA